MAADPLDFRAKKHEAVAPPPSPSPATSPATGQPGGAANALPRPSTAQVLVAIVAALAAAYVAKLVLIVLIVAVLLAFVLAPFTDLLQRIRLPRPLAAAIAVLVLMGALAELGNISYGQVADFSRELPRYAREVEGRFSKFWQRTEQITQSTSKVLDSTQNAAHTIKVQQQTSWVSLVTENLGTASEIIFAASFVPFLAYFMLTWQEHVRAATVSLFGRQNRTTAYVALTEIAKMIRAFIVGNVLVGLFMGGISTVVFGLLHLPYFYVTGFISGFLSLVPYLGVVIAALPPLLSGIGKLHGTGMLVVILTVLGLHVFSLNVLYPKFLGARVRLNPLAVTLALLFWGWMWGAMGLILAIPITAAAKIVFDHVESLRPYALWLGE